MLVSQVLALSLLAASALAKADITENYTISFETTDCDGSYGLGVVALSDLVRINPYRCASGEILHQVLSRSHSISGSYEAYTISSRELKIIKQDIEAWRKAQRKLLEKGASVIIE